MQTSDLFVVGIASSAGGLSPMIELLENASCHKNMCFVIVSHIDRFRESAIAKIVKQVSRLSTQVIVDGLELEHCGIYVIPPNQYVYLEGLRFRLMVRPTGGPNNCADFFFESLAKNFGANAIGVVLSGAAVGADGSKGIEAIKRVGGHTYAQDPQLAEFEDMPKLAIQTGSIDSVMTASQIGHELSLVSWGASL